MDDPKVKDKTLKAAFYVASAVKKAPPTKPDSSHPRIYLAPRVQNVEVVDSYSAVDPEDGVLALKADDDNYYKLGIYVEQVDGDDVGFLSIEQTPAAEGTAAADYLLFLESSTGNTYRFSLVLDGSDVTLNISQRRIVPAVGQEDISLARSDSGLGQLVLTNDDGLISYQIVL
jgi:hypothetical protein